MSLDGSVVIDLACDGGRVLQARITPPRPVPLGPMVQGRPVGQVIATIGALFRVCGMAQSVAGVEAAEAALGLAVGGRTRLARRLLVGAETLREHLLRIAFDEAILAGGKQDTGSLRRIMGLPTRLKESLFPGADAFVPGRRAGIPGGEALEVAADAGESTRTMVSDRGAALGDLDRDGFAAWARAGSTVAARLAGVVLARDWAMIGCPAASEREGGLADTSCYARQGDAPLVRAFLSETGEAGLAARLAARIVEASKLSGQIAEGLDALRADSDSDDGTAARFTSADGGANRSGTASAEAARGRLEHRVVLDDDGLVADYAIAAPTTSHFGSGGIAARSLASLSARTREELAAQADLIIRTIDPCVDYQVTFADA